jgi:hypothetical protein
VLERALHARVHVVMVEGHEHGVHHDAERDEQVHERVEHDEGKEFRQSEQSLGIQRNIIVAKTEVPCFDQIKILNIGAL